MKIRTAAPEDFPFVVELTREIHAAHVAAEPALFKPEVGLTEEAFREQLRDPKNRFWIAEKDGAPGGLAFGEIWDRPENAYRYPLRMLYIQQIGVKAGQQGQGIGKKLVEHAILEARRSGVSRIELDVWAFNRDARAFYENAGFEVFNSRMVKRI